jgi:Flagellar protein FliS
LTLGLFFLFACIARNCDTLSRGGSRARPSGRVTVAGWLPKGAARGKAATRPAMRHELTQPSQKPVESQGRLLTAVHRVEDRLYELSGCVGCSAINNAYLVLGELTRSLNEEAAPELAKRLGALYAYMQSRLIEANQKQQYEPLAEVLGPDFSLHPASRSLTLLKTARTG